MGDEFVGLLINHRKNIVKRDLESVYGEINLQKCQKLIQETKLKCFSNVIQESVNKKKKKLKLILEELKNQRYKFIIDLNFSKFQVNPQEITSIQNILENSHFNSVLLNQMDKKRLEEKLYIWMRLFIELKVFVNISNFEFIKNSFGQDFWYSLYLYWMKNYKFFILNNKIFRKITCYYLQNSFGSFGKSVIKQDLNSTLLFHKITSNIKTENIMNVDIEKLIDNFNVESIDYSSETIGLKENSLSKTLKPFLAYLLKDSNLYVENNDQYHEILCSVTNWILDHIQKFIEDFNQKFEKIKEGFNTKENDILSYYMYINDLLKNLLKYSEIYDPKYVKEKNELFDIIKNSFLPLDVKRDILLFYLSRYILSYEVCHGESISEAIKNCFKTLMLLKSQSYSDLNIKNHSFLKEIHSYLFIDQFGLQNCQKLETITFNFMKKSKNNTNFLEMTNLFKSIKIETLMDSIKGKIWNLEKSILFRRKMNQVKTLQNHSRDVIAILKYFYKKVTETKSEILMFDMKKIFYLFFEKSKFDYYRLLEFIREWIQPFESWSKHQLEIFIKKNGIIRVQHLMHYESLEFHQLTSPFYFQNSYVIIPYEFETFSIHYPNIRILNRGRSTGIHYYDRINQLITNKLTLEEFQQIINSKRHIQEIEVWNSIFKKRDNNIRVKYEKVKFHVEQWSQYEMENQLKKKQGSQYVFIDNQWILDDESNPWRFDVLENKWILENTEVEKDKNGVPLIESCKKLLENKIWNFDEKNNFGMFLDLKEHDGVFIILKGLALPCNYFLLLDE